MGKKIRVGILRETKSPPDKRVPLTPLQIIELIKLYPNTEFFVQPSELRCYKDKEYEALNIPVKEDLESCDILMGVKEVDRHTLIPGKTYLFFAHVGKKQPYNRDMLHDLLKKEIRLIDYEYLTTERKQRVVAFGRWAGILGGYHGLRAIGLKTNKFKLRPPHQLKDLYELWKELRMIDLNPDLKILVTGRGRVAHGVMETLNSCDLLTVTAEEFLTKKFDIPVVCQLSSKDYYKHKNGCHFNVDHFHNYPEEYKSSFLPYTKVTDILITGHYWDSRSSVFFTKGDMKEEDFNISVIADITCDINGSIPSTIKASTIADPLFCYNPYLEIEEPVFANPQNITVMSIDNLASELPRDASSDFGSQLINNVLGDILTEHANGMIERATITKDGKLGPAFKYLSDYLVF
jgi:saccharopine dehydrogenase (NAD+, L-lysine forming)